MRLCGLFSVSEWLGILQASSLYYSKVHLNEDSWGTLIAEDLWQVIGSRWDNLKMLVVITELVGFLHNLAISAALLFCYCSVLWTIYYFVMGTSFPACTGINIYHF